MKKQDLGFKVAAWVLTASGLVPKCEVRRRLRKAINEELRKILEKGTVVEVKCPMCKKRFTQEVVTDNAPVALYCGKGCKKRAADQRKNTKIHFCQAPSKNKYPSLEIARKHANIMDGDEAWKLTPYPCPVGHWHLGRLEGRIVSTPKEKE